jgi:transcriptional regulator
MPSIPQGTLDLLILQAISRQPAHGYAIARWIEHATEDLLAVQEGALYPALGRLQQKGWITGEWGISELKKQIKIYELTPKGRAALRRRTASWQALVRAMSRVFDAR